MKRLRSVIVAWLVGAMILSIAAPACAPQSGERKQRPVLFVGIDTSGSFYSSGSYDDALAFVSHYIYGHLHEMGGLDKPRELFVGTIGGKAIGEPKAFHPIHDFEGKDITQIEASLREWFSPTDTITDFNAFFSQIARIAKERNLVLAPITVMLVSDGIPDVGTPNLQEGSSALYDKIDLSPMEYLSRSITIRITYTSPKAGENWRKFVPRQRIRLLAVEAEVMKGWKDQLKLEVADPAGQDRLWKWVRDNVDFRVRSTGI